MVKFVVSAEKSGTTSCVAIGDDGDVANTAFQEARDSGKFERVELFLFPPVTKRWSATTVAKKAKKKAAATE